MMARQPLIGWDEVRRHWFLHFALGVLLVVLGLTAIGRAFTATLISILFFGWLLVGSGLLQGITAFQVQSWNGFFLHLLGGLLEVIVGVLVVAAPAESAVGLTLLLAVYLLVGGLFRTTAALWLAYPGSGWAAFGGLISFLLGLAIWRHWPISGLWFLGTCVGIDLLLHGAAWIAFGLNVRRQPEPVVPLERVAGI